MNQRKIGKLLMVGLLVFSLNGCALLSGGTRSDGPAKVDDLVGRIERVYVDSELSKERMQDALVQLETIAAADFDNDAVTAYAQLMELLERSEKQEEALREAVEPMKDSAGPVFKQWASDIDQIAGPTLRERSQERLKAAQERYDAIVSAVDPAQESYAAFNQAVRDHALFLSHDFNPAALVAIRDEVKSVAELAEQLENHFDASMMATRAYVEANSLPVAASVRREREEEEEMREEERRDERKERTEKVKGTRTRYLR